MNELNEDATKWSPGVSKAPARAHVDAPKPRQAPEDDARAVVAGLLKKVHAKPHDDLDPIIQIYLGRVINLLVITRPEIIRKYAAFYETAIDVLLADKPNLILARSVTKDLMVIADRSSYGLTRILSFIAGYTPLSATIAALLLATVFSALLLFLFAGAHRALFGGSLAAAELIPTLQGNTAGLMILSVHAAFIGGIVSVLARVGDFVETEIVNPVVIFVSVFRKPFLGAAFGVLVFSVINAGLLTIPGVNLQGTQGIFTAWVIGFLSGFSERLADDVILTVGDRFASASLHSRTPRQQTTPRSPATPHDGEN